MPKLTHCFRFCLLAVVLLVVAGHPAPGYASRQAAVSPAPAAVTYYVTPGGLGDCLSWVTACELQDALAIATSGDQVWAAQGVYYPDVGGGQTPDSRDATFTLKAGVQLYGGFAGTETSLGERDWQAHAAVLSGDVDGNDIVDASGVVTDTANIIGSNSYHVVSGASGITRTARLDGFTITGGKADGDYTPNPCNLSCGGGMYNYQSSPSVANAIFRGNWGVYGGGMYNNTSTPLVSNVTFTGNRADYGAGMQNTYGDPNLVRVTFSGNQAAYQGGGIRSVNYSNPTLTNVIIRGNQATYGGGMYNIYFTNPSLVSVMISGNRASNIGGGIYQGGHVISTLTNATISGNQAYSGGGIFFDYGNDQVRNTILWGNTAVDGAQVYKVSGVVTFTHSNIQGAFSSGSWNASLGADGGGNLDADPLFLRNPSPGPDNTSGTADDDYGDLHLQAASPVIDVGENSLVPPDVLDLDSDGDVTEPLPYDLDGQPRFFNGVQPVVDMGAYEAQVSQVIPWITSHPSDPSNDNTPSFAFTATGIVGTPDYQCLLDEASGGTWADCTSPITYTTPLADGQHTFQMKASDSIVAESRPPDSFTWLIDATAPTVQITSMPPDPTIQRTAVFTFTASEAATFFCMLDQGPPATCVSPQSYANLAHGNHTFSVYAKDALGNISQPAGYAWTVEVAIYYAKPGAGGDCLNWASACDLQTVLGRAFPGDQVWVAEGVYKPGTTRTSTFLLKDRISIYGGFAGTETELSQRDWQTHVSVLSGDVDGDDLNTDGNFIAETWNDLRGANAYHVVTAESGIAQTARLDGFTITAGFANGSDSYAKSGSGVFNQSGSPTLTNLIFCGNRAFEYGGGIINMSGSSPSLTKVTFSGNLAKYGGGVANYYDSSPSLAEMVFQGNKATSNGGGLYNYRSVLSLTNALFIGNQAAGRGGGIYGRYGNISLANVTFSGNRADSGGGMCNFYSGPSLVNVRFINNQAIFYGGGMLNESSSPSLANVIFSGNRSNLYGGGMSNYQSNPGLVNVVLSGNHAASEGGGLHNSTVSGPKVHNSILWGNTAASESQVYNQTSGSIVFDHSIVQASFSGGGWDTDLGIDLGGNLDADPLFVRNPSPGADNTWGTADDDYGDLHLQLASPAIDAGNNALVPPDTLDLDSDGDTNEPLPYDLEGQPRFFNGVPPLVDIGAYESQVLVPIVQITAQPANPTHENTPAFAFTSYSGVGALTYQCVMDEAGGGAWADCTSPITYTIPLADGQHTFQVKASDSAGTQGRPASYTWVIDTQAPAVQITGQPFNPSNDPDPVFTFSSPDGGQTYQCKLDSAAWESCASPKGYNLPEGEHTFQVKATDAAGNEGAPASFIWTIDLTAPAAPSIASPAEGEIIPFTAAGWNRPAFSGQAEPGATVAVYLSAPGAMHLAGALHLNVQPLCTATANPAGEWTCPSAQALPPGTNRVTATATDAAGNTGQPCAERAFIVLQVVYLPVIAKP